MTHAPPGPGGLVGYCTDYWTVQEAAYTTLKQACSNAPRVSWDYHLPTSIRNS
jgi:hypothetical protein